MTDAGRAASAATSGAAHRTTRRGALAGLAVMGLGTWGLGGCVPLDTSAGGRLEARLRIIEAAAGGTLGVALRETGSGRTLAYRGEARFPHCSSFKLSLAALLLQRAESGEADPGERLRWSEADLVAHSSFTRQRLGEGASLLELAEAAQKTSDNTAANLLLRKLGGPAALTRFWRSIGDETSRLDRYELELNHVPSGEMRDTSSPLAMAQTLEAILFGDALNREHRAMLRQWMAETQSGMRRVRAGLPRDWASGDKTGTSIWPGMRSVYVDIGYAVAPGRAPVTFAAYYRAAREHGAIDPAAEAVLAQVGQVLADWAARLPTAG